VPRFEYLLLCCILTGGSLCAQKKAPAPQEPPEEDESVAVEQYSFNPLQAEKEMKVGSFYFKKGSYKAAARRFREASKWNPALTDAWLRLGEAEEKLNDSKAAREAYSKFLELAPNDKRAPEIKKKIDSKTESAASKK
jgi:tetratricopeptide (TPR) repeat protein